jgi:sarcosine oxidase subunit beta
MTDPAHIAPVIIIGGGLHGSSTALHLARAGVHALVLEKNYIARHASGVNAGGVRTLSRHLAEVPLSLASREIWLTLQEWVDDDCGFDQNGQMRVAEDEADVATLRTRDRAGDYAQHSGWFDCACRWFGRPLSYDPGFSL